jgi:hypothetical protein
MTFYFTFQLLKHKADVNFVNEHGNTALHYATFWNYPAIAEDLVEWGGLVTIENKYGETPLDKSQGSLGKKLHGECNIQNINLSFGLCSVCAAGLDPKKIRRHTPNWLRNVDSQKN